MFQIATAGPASNRAVVRMLEDSQDLSRRKLEEWDRVAAAVAELPAGPNRRRAEKCLQIELEQIRNNVHVTGRLRLSMSDC